jgi:hypothetical protein
MLQTEIENVICGTTQRNIKFVEINIIKYMRKWKFEVVSLDFQILVIYIYMNIFKKNKKVCPDLYLFYVDCGFLWRGIMQYGRAVIFVSLLILCIILSLIKIYIEI